MPNFRNHTIEMVGDCGVKGLMCEVHPQEALELYCETCGVLTCRNCQLSLHRDHSGHRWVKEKAELLRENLVSSIDSMESQSERLRGFIELMEDSPVDIEASIHAAKSAHSQVMDDLIRVANASKSSFEEELKNAALEHFDKLRVAKGIMQNLSVSLWKRLVFLIIFEAD